MDFVKNQLMKLLFIGFLFFSAIGFAQPLPMGFLSQDSLLQIYHAPKFRWADSIVHIIRQQAVGHMSEVVYQQIKALQQKNQAAKNPPAPYRTAHSAILREEVSPKRKKRMR
jgi:hypothetical protein